MLGGGGLLCHSVARYMFVRVCCIVEVAIATSLQNFATYSLFSAPFREAQGASILWSEILVVLHVPRELFLTTRLMAPWALPRNRANWNEVKIQS